MLWSIAFWRGAGERAVKTFAQALVAVIGVGAVGLLDVDWLGALSAATLATVISLLLTVLGLFAVLRMPIREYPAIDPPVIQKFNTGAAPVLSVALASDMPCAKIIRPGRGTAPWTKTACSLSG